MKIYDQMLKMWKTDGLDARTSRWADNINKGLPMLKSARRKLHAWSPLRIYVSTTQAMNAGSSCILSLRFWGQEIGRFIVNKQGNVRLDIKKNHERTNRRDFKFILAAGKYDWKGAEAKVLRQYFADYDKEHRSAKMSQGKRMEHFIETDIIQEMKLSKRSKFNGKLAGVQPVLLNGNLPFQMPVPFSASKGTPQISQRGNMDILARRPGRMLSIWELKAPNKIEKAVAQVYIYGIALAMMLRTKKGATWANIFEMKQIPKKLKIELVVAVSESQKPKFDKQLSDLLKDNPIDLPTLGTSFKFVVALYDAKTHVLQEFKPV